MSKQAKVLGARKGGLSKSRAKVRASRANLKLARTRLARLVKAGKMICSCR